MNKIPVFLHIPKNAGTYVLGVTMNLFRHYGISQGWRNKIDWNLNLRRIYLENNQERIATLYVHDPEKIRNTNKHFKRYKQDNYCNVVDVKDFKEEFKKKKITLFSIIIEAKGASFIKNKLYEDICEQNDLLPFYYTILRNPYDRALSMYYYITGLESAHELTHKAIKSKTFVDYIKSNELEDSWLIRNLNDIPNHKAITEKDFTDVCSILNRFDIEDISNVDILIDDVFSKCCGITHSVITDNKEEINKNSTNKKNKISFNDLDEETKKIFLIRTEFDRKIYNKYSKKRNI